MRFKQLILLSIVFVMCKNSCFVLMFKFILQFFVLKIKILHFKGRNQQFFDKIVHSKEIFHILPTCSKSCNIFKFTLAKYSTFC